MSLADRWASVPENSESRRREVPGNGISQLRVSLCVCVFGYGCVCVCRCLCFGIVNLSLFVAVAFYLACTMVVLPKQPATPTMRVDTLPINTSRALFSPMLAKAV